MAETEQSKTVTIGDRPAKEDTLGFKPYVIAIAEFLTARDTKPPLTISIEGEWGRGKSSFMEQLQEQILQEYEDLEEEKLKEKERELQRELQRIGQGWTRIEKLKLKLQKLKLKKIFWVEKIFLQVKFKFRQKTKIVWFNAWRHDKAESLWAAFALSFLEQISTNSRISSDFVPNGLGKLRLFWHRFNLKEKPLKAIQTLFITSFIVGTVGVILMVSSLVPVYVWQGRLQFVDLLCQATGRSKEQCEKLEQELNLKPKIKDNTPKAIFVSLVTSLLILLMIGGSLGGVAIFLGKLRDFIGDPKMDLTQYLKSPDYDSQIDFIEKFHEDFSKIVDAYAGKGRKVYVFIDDLDRCELGKSADLLQALNLMISNDPNLIFILGMDREKVAAAITFKQKDILPYLDSIAQDSQEPYQIQLNRDNLLLGGDKEDKVDKEEKTFVIRVDSRSKPEDHQLMKKLDYGFAFLEKFVQLSFSVPKPSEKTLELFLKEFFPDKQQNPQETTTQDTPPTTSETTEQPELPIFPLIQKEPTSDDITNLVKMVAPFFDYNPRRLKQYLNVLRLRSYITYYAIGVTSEERNSLTIEQLGKFVAITLKYPRLLRRLEEDNELLGKLEHYARSPSSSLIYLTNSDSTNNNQETKYIRDWIDNDSKLKELLCDGNSLASNQEIKKLLEVSAELKLHPRYFKLRQFLDEGKWREADEETLNVMLQVANRQRQGYLDVSDIEKFPCEDLRIIDRLWVKYSKGKFGFSVQKEIYMKELDKLDRGKELRGEEGEQREYNKEEVWINFGVRVGWIKGGYWLRYSKLTWNLEAPEGQLPACACVRY
ncbi:MAG: GUN4 domain-containing protein [Xenococcaceae cyanobacterium MO_188.B29]|nr:GUN4 domain-containing protein [Xenococcaceae cyanobacterium MO_188.B29]